MGQDWRAIGSVGTVGLEIVLSIVLGVLGGQWLDRKLGGGGWITLLGLALGVASAVRAVLRTARDMKRLAAREEERERRARRELREDLLREARRGVGDAPQAPPGEGRDDSPGGAGPPDDPDRGGARGATPDPHPPRREPP